MEKKKMIIGIACGAIALVILIVGVIVTVGIFNKKSEPSVVLGRDPSFTYLKGLDMTFNQLAEDGYFSGESFNGNPTYTFNRIGKEVRFAFREEGLDNKRKPICVVTTLNETFPELSGLSAKDAEALFAPYLSVRYTVAGGEGTYETDNYIFNIDTGASGTLHGDAAVSVSKKGVNTNEITNADLPTVTESNFYILPYSNQRLLTYVDIQDFTKQDIMLARNEIFARHGRRFDDPDVRAYFEAQSWYSGTIEPVDFSMELLSNTERQNIEFLKQHENGANGISQNVGNAGSVVTYNGFMLPQSSYRILTYADIADMSLWQLSIARNEIYARHGYIFNDKDLRSYFQAQSWYSGYVPAAEFDTSVLSATEKYNIAFIKSYE